jgi:hypothetical protein
MNKKDNLSVIDPKLLNVDDGSSISSNNSNIKSIVYFIVLIHIYIIIIK